MFPEYTNLNIVLLLGLWLLLPLLSSANQVCRAAVLLPIVVVQLYYTHWRYSETLEAFEFSAAVLWQQVFFGTELLAILYSIWQCITLIRYTDRTAQCDRILSQTNVNNAKTVDLFIPTHSESKLILTETIKAAKKDTHSALTIWICDDGSRDWLKNLCAKEGVNYLRRPATQPVRTKAANLNWAIPHGKADYLLCLDADFQLYPALTTRLTSFFEDTHVGLVQAPQHFRNPDRVQRNLFGEKAWAEEQRFFFDISLPSRDAWGNTLCVGSCWATRRSVIEELEGYPLNSIVEDVYFGYRVKELGYKSVYLNEKLATGLAAEDTPSYLLQRTRWCRGAMALLADPHGPLRSSGLKLKDRLFYLEIPFYWITHLHLLLLLIAPALYGFFGLNVFNCTTEELFTILLPKNILVCTVFYWVSRGRCMPLITSVQKTLSVFQVVPAIFLGMFFPGNKRFHVTPKDISHTGRTFNWRFAAPFIFLGVITTVAVVKTLSQNHSAFYWSDYSAYNALLSAYSLVTVFLCCLICVDKPQNILANNNELPITGSWVKTTAVLAKRIFT